MENILILGALPKTQQDIELYNALIEARKPFANEVKSPIDTANFKWDDGERYERAFEAVRNADLVVGEQSQPSTGQGMEVRECDLKHKPLIVVAQEWSKISGLVKGCPATKEIIFYSSVEDIKTKLADVLSRY